MSPCRRGYSREGDGCEGEGGVRGGGSSLLGGPDVLPGGPGAPGRVGVEVPAADAHPPRVLLQLRLLRALHVLVNLQSQAGHGLGTPQHRGGGSQDGHEAVGKGGWGRSWGLSAGDSGVGDSGTSPARAVTLPCVGSAGAGAEVTARSDNSLP